MYRCITNYFKLKQRHFLIKTISVYDIFSNTQNGSIYQKTKKLKSILTIEKKVILILLPTSYYNYYLPALLH